MFHIRHVSYRSRLYTLLRDHRVMYADEDYKKCVADITPACLCIVSLISISAGYTILLHFIEN